MINLKFAELHTPLFLNGTNWGVKLDVKNTTKGRIKLDYDREQKELIVSSGNNCALIPTSNVVSMTPSDPHFFDKLIDTVRDMAPIESFTPHGVAMPEGFKAPERIKPGPKPKATQISSQASSPNDHVFQGNGAGRTND